MLTYSTSLLPMNPRRSAILSGSPYNRGPGFGTQPWRAGFKGLHSGCGCSPTTGCNCGPTYGSGFSGFRQAPGSLDAIIQAGANWLSSFGQSQLGTSGAVPPSYTTVGGTLSQLTPYLPWIIVAFVAYKVIK